MQAVRRLAAPKIWAPHNHIGGSDSPDVEWLEVLEDRTEPPARPSWHAPRWRLPPGHDNPTGWVPDRETYDTVPHKKWVENPPFQN